MPISRISSQEKKKTARRKQIDWEPSPVHVSAGTVVTTMGNPIHRFASATLDDSAPGGGSKDTDGGSGGGGGDGGEEDGGAVDAEWQAHVDDDTGHTYWCHVHTGESTWHKPT